MDVLSISFTKVEYSSFTIFWYKERIMITFTIAKFREYGLDLTDQKEEEQESYRKALFAGQCIKS